ncbi:glycoside hydrolase family 104 protein [Synechococcus sp. CS-602]|uniref:glycoside hydrolase family 24 protein n=2 Tax=Synechococcales TaxID=1890424 RepID=UPI000E77A231|nr:MULTISPECIES: glycoside hydrolase family 104 protein [Synechococcaceae]MCT0202126.1 glycoside hydrolase family 104 protein [Synechococcus sp. CS-603]MCT0205695.1 glycoside hydrolase family 104 protein [Synechococcus sp. CS-602]MCT0244904.1 glycoside hydrolase family 104 protein [Synechococcus sp. CS-601]
MPGLPNFFPPARLLLSALLIGAAAPAQATIWQEIRRPSMSAPMASPLEPRSVAAVDVREAADTARSFAITPERRALLNTIRFAEGTWANGQDQGYWILFGGSLMSSLDRHPNRVMRTARYASAAAGAYQFMPPTWDMVTRRMGLGGFGPEVQDQAAIFLIRHRGALELADRGVMTPQLAAKLAPEWASFPTLAGRSFYGQPVKRFTELKQFYEANLSMLRASIIRRNDIAQAQTVEPPIAQCTYGSLACALRDVGSTPN